MQRGTDGRQPTAKAIGFHRILDVHRGRAQVQLSAPDWRLCGKDPNLGHQVVMDLAFDGQRRLDIDAVDVSLQIGQLLGRNEALGRLRLRQADPHFAPQPSSRPLGKERAQPG